MDRARARKIAHFNKRFTNPIARPLARYLPKLCVIAHVGRKSGRRYETPVNVFRHGDEFVFALTYGRQSDWVRNVLAAKGCEVTTLGRRYALVEPEVFRDDSRSLVSPPARPILALLGVDEFLRLKLSRPT